MGKLKDIMPGKTYPRSVVMSEKQENGTTFSLSFTLKSKEGGMRCSIQPSDGMPIIQAGDNDNIAIVTELLKDIAQAKAIGTEVIIGPIAKVASRKKKKKGEPEEPNILDAIIPGKNYPQSVVVEELVDRIVTTTTFTLQSYFVGMYCSAKFPGLSGPVQNGDYDNKKFVKMLLVDLRNAQERGAIITLGPILPIKTEM